MDEFWQYWHWFAGPALLLINIGASIHIVLYKVDSRAAIAWVGLIWLAPVFGPIFYFAFGINRIQRKAMRLRKRRVRVHSKEPVRKESLVVEVLPEDAAHLASLARLVGTVSGQQLLTGHRIEPFYNGDQAYPVMLQAIREAKQTVGLCSYIFNNDHAGGFFVEALGQAVARGVAVRVLIDDIGSHYTWNSVLHALHAAKVASVRFLPKLLPRYFAYANLCNHRKIMVVDGTLGFVGGMNIGDGNCHELKPPHPIQDLHFRVCGPVVTRLQEVFVEDWAFSSGELLQGDQWFPDVQACGTIPARGISSGPDADYEKMRMVLLGALSCARERVRIVTPYFLPDSGLMSALNVAALRGVQVDVVLPRISDLRLVPWAVMAQIESVLEHGCNVWFSPPPFTHTKLMLVDGVWTLLGSANWDPRSLRLNFEFDVECYDRELAASLEAAVHATIQRSERLTLAHVNRRNIFVKLRDGVARLLTPYL